MRRPGWKVWLVIALVVGAMVFASLFSQGSGELDFVREVVTHIEVRVAAGEQRERAVYGDLVDGQAWQHYEQAFDIVERYSASLDDLSKIEQWQSGDDDPEVGKLREAVRPALAHVRLGAHSKSVALGKLSINEHRWSRICWLVCSKELAADRDVEAVEVWLDTVAMVCDAGISAFVVKAFTDLWTDERIASLSPAGRERMQSGLEWLDERLAGPVDYEVSLLPGARAVLAGKYVGTGVWNRLKAWDSGFSPGARMARHFANGFRGLSVLEPPAERWSERERQFDEFEALVDPNGDGGWAMTRYLGAWKRSARSDIRLLRLALALHAGETPTPLQDPLGDAAIRIVDDGENWTLSSGHGVLLVERVVAKR